MGKTTERNGEGNRRRKGKKEKAERRGKKAAGRNGAKSQTGRRKEKTRRRGVLYFIQTKIRMQGLNVSSVKQSFQLRSRTPKGLNLT